MKRVRRDYSRKKYRNPLFKKRGESRKKRAAWRPWLYPAIGLVTAIGWIWFLAFSNTFRVTQVEITGNVKIPTWEIRDSIDGLMESRRWLVIPKRTMLFLTENDIVTYLQDAFVLESVEVQKDPPHKITVTVKERVSSIFMQLSDGSQAMLDLEGVVVRTYRPEEALDITRRYGPNLNEEPDPIEGLYVLLNDGDETVDLRDRTVKPEVVNAVIMIPKLVTENFSQAVEVGEMRTENFRTSTVKVVTNEGWSIYVDAAQSLPSQISNAASVIREKVGGDKPRLDYIDVRFDEKVFFKLR